jgi:DNA polymerase III delta prime subunit
VTAEMLAADRSKYLQFVLTDPRHFGKNSFYTETDALLKLEPEIAKREERNNKQPERLPVLEMLRKYGLGAQREHLLLAGKPGFGKSTTLWRLCVEIAEIALNDDLQPIPVFVELKGDKPILELIAERLEFGDLNLNAQEIKQLLRYEKFVLLLDGVNEIPSDNLRGELQSFRESNLTTPMVFTTRDLMVGGNLGIDKRLEMCPLTPFQLTKLVHKYLPEHGDKLLLQLRDRLKEIAETPLLLKMLCEVFDPETAQIPQNKAELFDLFDRKYQRHKEGVAISPDFRRFQSDILEHLAFTMLKGDTEKPTDAWLTLPRSKAERILEDRLKERGETNPASKAKEWIEALVHHHWLQEAADPQQIEFHHQLFQEYYAARHLRSMLQDKHPDLVDDDRLKHFYLNYLKWTEPLGLLLGLLDDEVQALRLVGLGLEVYCFLGARLAGEVKEGFQQQTVGLVNRLIVEKNLPRWLKLELWEKTRSIVVLPNFIPLLQDSNSSIRRIAIDAIVRMGDWSNVTDLLPLLQDSGFRIRQSAVRAIDRLEGKSNVSHLLPLSKNFNYFFRSSEIVQLGGENAVIELTRLLKVGRAYIRGKAAKGLGEIKEWNKISPFTRLLAINALLKSLESQHNLVGINSTNNSIANLYLSVIRTNSADSLAQIGDRKILPRLYQKLTDSKDNKIYKIIIAIQARCEFYNYDISCLSLTSQQSFLPSLAVNIGGDYVAGDKIQGNKIMGSQHNIDKLGNLNTGDVSIQGDQIGIQQPENPK